MSAWLICIAFGGLFAAVLCAGWQGRRDAHRSLVDDVRADAQRKARDPRLVVTDAMLDQIDNYAYEGTSAHPDTVVALTSTIRRLRARNESMLVERVLRECGYTGERGAA